MQRNMFLDRRALVKQRHFLPKRKTINADCAAISVATRNLSCRPQLLAFTVLLSLSRQKFVSFYYPLIDAVSVGCFLIENDQLVAVYDPLASNAKCNELQ